MIVYLTQGISRIAFRIKTYGNQSQLADWHGLQLLIVAGEAGQPCNCNPGGSPWFFYGCWPGVRTGEDVANTRPDVPVMCFPAFGTDNEGRIVFRLGDKLSTTPPGRYTGIVRLVPKMKPLNMVPLYSLGKPKAPEKVILPPEFAFGAVSCSDAPEPKPEPKKPEPACCTLAVFDIDIGPECSDHFIDQTAVTLMLDNCTMEL